MLLASRAPPPAWAPEPPTIDSGGSGAAMVGTGTGACYQLQSSPSAAGTLIPPPPACPVDTGDRCSVHPPVCLREALAHPWESLRIVLLPSTLLLLSRPSWKPRRSAYLCLRSGHHGPAAAHALTQPSPVTGRGLRAHRPSEPQLPALCNGRGHTVPASHEDGLHEGHSPVRPGLC